MSYIEEIFLAARGVAALLLGRRNAPSYFDLGMRGLAGSMAAFFIALMINASLPAVLGLNPAGQPPVWQQVMLALVLFVMQLGFAALVLRQLGRSDGLMPYLVADNWATFFVTAVSVVLVLLGVTGEVAMIVLGVAVLVIEINIARLIVTLSGWQIAAFLVAQFVGIVIGLMAVGAILPTPVT